MLGLYPLHHILALSASLAEHVFIPHMVCPSYPFYYSYTVHINSVLSSSLLKAYICFARPLYYMFIALKTCLSIITFVTVNIISSAAKLTPATRSMINKAQYCQRRWHCNIIPFTHSHGACNLVLVLEISLQL